jgi:dTDP-4-amino-4,6-dideoxygalactose transaminase
MNPIPYGKQHITEADIQAVIETLQSDYLTQGPKIKEFEEVFAQYIGAKYAVAVANGTAALHLCTLALDVKPGDKVITTPITFAASANCIRYCGGEVVFADIDPETYLLDINEVRKLLQNAPKGTYKGIIPVDFAGRAVDLEGFRKLADEYGCWVVEDACHAPGGFFIDSNGQQQNCGNGNFADLAIFSFHPVKHIACGEGGMITTNSEELYKKLMMLRTHGITRDTNLFINSIDFATGMPKANSQQLKANPHWPSWYMEMQTLGFNYRLTDFQAALGISQLKRADEGIIKRREIAAQYFEAFKSIPEITDRNYESANRLPQHSGMPNAKSQTPIAKSLPQYCQTPTANNQQPTANSQLPFPNGHAHHLYVIEVEDRLGLYNHLREHQIFAQIHYIPCHLMPYYRNFGWKEGDMPNAEKYYKNCISIPMYPTLTKKEQDFVIELINKFTNNYEKKNIRF